MTPQELATEAKCFDACVPDGMQLALQSYLLDRLRIRAGGSVQTVEELIAQAKCYDCIPKGMQMAVQIYLLDELLSIIDTF